MYLYRAFFLASLWTAPLFAAATEPDTSHQSKKWQIWAYTTAAPSFIGDSATVLDQTTMCCAKAPMAGRACQATRARCHNQDGMTHIKPCQFVPTWNP